MCAVGALYRVWFHVDYLVFLHILRCEGDWGTVMTVAMDACMYLHPPFRLHAHDGDLHCGGGTDGDGVVARCRSLARAALYR